MLGQMLPVHRPKGALIFPIVLLNLKQGRGPFVPPSRVVSILLCPWASQQMDWRSLGKNPRRGILPPTLPLPPPQSLRPIQVPEAPERVHSFVPSSRPCHIQDIPGIRQEYSPKLPPGHQCSDPNPILQIWKLRQVKPRNLPIVT